MQPPLNMSYEDTFSLQRWSKCAHTFHLLLSANENSSIVSASRLPKMEARSYYDLGDNFNKTIFIALECQLCKPCKFQLQVDHKLLNIVSRQHILEPIRFSRTDGVPNAPAEEQPDVRRAMSSISLCLPMYRRHIQSPLTIPLTINHYMVNILINNEKKTNTYSKMTRTTRCLAKIFSLFVIWL